VIEPIEDRPPSATAAADPVSGRSTATLELPAVADSLTVVRQMLTGLGEALALEPSAIGDLKIAVSEACANCCLHAYRDRPAGPMRVSCYVRGTTLWIAVVDRGIGMGPTRLGEGGSPGLGLGLPLMAALSDELRLRSGAEGGSEVWMRFELNGAGAP
jgi:serine/threonine-protein kinase RsbW